MYFPRPLHLYLFCFVRQSVVTCRLFGNDRFSDCSRFLAILADSSARTASLLPQRRSRPTASACHLRLSATEFAAISNRAPVAIPSVNLKSRSVPLSVITDLLLVVSTDGLGCPPLKHGNASIPKTISRAVSPQPSFNYPLHFSVDRWHFPSYLRPYDRWWMYHPAFPRHTSWYGLHVHPRCR